MTTNVDRYVAVTGKTEIANNVAVLASGHQKLSRKAVYRCAEDKNIDRNAVLIGRWSIERSAALKGTHIMRGLVAVRSEDNQYPVIETDNLKLRTSAVYANPVGLFPLQVPYGDWTTSGVSVPLKLIDQETNLWHASDRAIKGFAGVLKDGVPMTTGFKTFKSYTDATGRQIAAVRFNSRQSGTLSARLWGVAYTDGVLLENPADIAIDVLENLQGYSWSFINHAQMGVYRAECLKDDMKLRVLLDKPLTVKKFFSILADCTNAVHTSDAGHGLVRRKGLI